MTNTEIPSPAAGAPHEDPRAPRPAPDRFFDAVRRTGLSRGHDRWVAGVCGAVAHRLGVNPAAVRVATVLLALLGGVGLLLYGVAWALLPDATGRIEAQAAHRGDVSASLVAAVGLVVLDLLGGAGLGLPWIWG
ncbi:PspC domain-containing protein [Kineococcus esterisolvens]|uniref:PspC domain-containing protein n=1 Tax=unclassified Kineococcus TaxID=2621656 RepID=UPI003D7E00D1